MNLLRLIFLPPALTATFLFAAETEESILERIKAPRFPNRDFLITDYGAQAGADCTEAIKNAIESCSKEGGGRVVIPPGTFFTGAVNLKSNVNLHLSEGATLKFDTDPSKYPIVYTRWEGIECMNYSPLIYSYGQHNIAVTGKGMLDGSASKENWWQWKGGKSGKQAAGRNRLFKMGEEQTPVEQRIFGAGYYLRPSFIQFYKGENFLIEEVTIIRAPMWVIHPVLCKNITIRDVRVNSLGPNNDGCDPESCRDVLIENSFFDTGDDCMAIKSGRNNDGRRVNVPSENMVIRNCVMSNGHGGMTIGSEISGGCRNIFVSNLRMGGPNLDQAIRFKTNAQRGGAIENIGIRNVEITHAKVSAISIEFNYEEGSKGSHLPVLRNLVIENVTAKSCGRAIFMEGFEGAVFENIVIKNSIFEGTKQRDRIRNAGMPALENVKIVDAEGVSLWNP